MAFYEIVATCFSHTGEIVKIAKNRMEADTIFLELKNSALKQLNVPSKESALVEIIKKGGEMNFERIKRERIVH